MSLVGVTQQYIIEAFMFSIILSLTRSPTILLGSVTVHYSYFFNKPRIPRGPIHCNEGTQNIFNNTNKKTSINTIKFSL